MTASYDSFIKKAKIFLREAEVDLKSGCYNKAVSASWFALEMLIKGILTKRQGNAPKKVGNLIVNIGRLMIGKIRDVNLVINDIKIIYEARKDIDHRNLLADKTLSEHILNKTEAIFGILLSLL
ncbi:MAG: HEPN domain-containing protein [Candidatus Njordarchaeia archaeon]|nr:HEPN domain-containing protein [Candidatus Korarchaeota archaeon]